jgi:tetratricopeptide (TPR) repeat protein/S1-C subfamily serine protease
MKKLFYLALITCSSLLLIPAACSQSQTTNPNQSALAAGEISTESIQQTAEAITVKITVGSSNGSGILIAQAGNTYTVVTNSHVIGRGNNYQITTVDGKIHQATLKQNEQPNNQDDLALLQFQATEKYTLASLGDAQQVTPNQSVFTSGFADDSDKLIVNGGKIGQISEKPIVGGYQIGFTNSTKQGMSGGALLNDQGKVIGVLGLGAAAILDNAYTYADGSRPDAQMLEKLRANSFAVPVASLIAQIPQNDLSREPVTTNPAQKPTQKTKYTGLPGKIDSIAQQITVRIDSKNNGNGSGVIVAHNGDTYYVATAGHVVQNQDDYTIVAPDGQSYPVAKTTIKTFEGLDLAVVQFQSQQAYTVATLGNYDLNYNYNKELRWVFVSGFPGQKAETKQLPPRLLTAGLARSKDQANFLAKDAYSLTEGYGLLYSNQSFPGMSGGAILDSQGQVVGINTGAEDEVVVDKTGDIAEISLGFSLGVPIGTLIGLAESAGIGSGWLQQKSSTPSEPTESEIAAIYEQLFTFKAPSSNATEVDWLNYGNQLWRGLQFDKAIAAFEQAIQLNPNSHYAHYGKGLALVEQQKYQQARDAFKQATKFAVNFSPAWHMLGNTLKWLKQYPQALNTYDQAIKISPEDFVLYVQRGEAFRKLKRYSDAISSYNQAIKIKPHPWTYNNRANVYRELKDYQRAIADYNQILKLDPNFAEVYSNRGNAYADLKDYQRAITDYNQTLKLDPNFAQAYNNRGSVFSELKDYQRAIADYNQAIKLDPNFAEVYSNRGNAYAELKDYQRAITDYNQTLKLDPNFAQAYNKRGLAYIELKDYQRAIADYNQAIKLDPNYAEAYNNRGLVYLPLKDYQAAIIDFDQAIKLDPNFALAYLSRALAYGFSGDTPSGIADLQKAAQLFQQQGNTEGYQKTQQLLQQVQGAKEEYPDAIADCTQAISLNPNDAEPYICRGLIYSDLKEYQSAIADFNQALKLDPNYAEAYNNRGIAYLNLKDYQRASADFNQALKLDPNYAEAYSNRSIAYVLLKEYQAAIADLDQAIQLNPNLAQAYYLRANTYGLLGDTPSRIADLQKAAQLYQQQGNTKGYQITQQLLEELQGAK